MAEKTENRGKILLKWEVMEFEKYQRTFMWYFLMGGGALALFVYAIWTLNFLFAIIIVIIATIVIIHERRDPDRLLFKIMEDGIQLDETFIPFKEVKKFWLVYEPPEVKNLYFDLKRTFRPELSIPLINTNPVLVRRLLLRYLQEDLTKQDISADDQMGRILKV
ncbi:MAG: hypothetical protein WC752_04075 [Patescibacteria group bacterium]|jgi:hypothetical protein